MLLNSRKGLLLWNTDTDELILSQLNLVHALTPYKATHMIKYRKADGQMSGCYSKCKSELGTGSMAHICDNFYVGRNIG